MTRRLVLVACGAVGAVAGWVAWVLAHAPYDTDPCDLCGCRVVPPTCRPCSPNHPVFHDPRKD